MSLKHPKLLNNDRLFETDSDGKVLTETENSAIFGKDVKVLFGDEINDLNFIARCECGHLSGNFFIGTQCPRCKMVVRTNFCDELKYRGWISLSKSMPPILHPIMYKVLRKWIGKWKNRFIIDRMLDVTDTLPPTLENVLGKGFIYFHHNFDSIINYFANEYQHSAKHKKRDEYLTFVKMYRDTAFVTKIPVLNQALHLITQSGSMRYSDSSSDHILEMLMEIKMTSYAYNNSVVRDDHINRKMRTIYKAYIAYTDSIITDKLSSKKGFLRKAILGSRYHLSFRGVIVPIIDPHEGDELFIPWKIALNIYKLEILNLLTNRRKLSVPDALDKLTKAIMVYDQDIMDILNTLIEECPFKGLPVLFGRNPWI